MIKLPSENVQVIELTGLDEAKTMQLIELHRLNGDTTVLGYDDTLDSSIFDNNRNFRLGNEEGGYSYFLFDKKEVLGKLTTYHLKEKENE